MPGELVIESLEKAGEVCADPAPLIYARLFELRPDYAALFEMDTDGGVRGSMLATCFEVILGIIDGQPSQRVILSAARFSHGGYGVPEADIDVMFEAIRDTCRRLMGPAWSEAHEADWDAVMREIAAIA
ncbi:globin [Hyphomonas sp.]|uniref:globin n=1 Tax=Hyphomonas sp. TaxID=87 RepID=UPI0039193CFE